MKQFTEEELTAIVQEIDYHFQKNNYSSYDPCDIKALPLFLGWEKVFSNKKFGKFALFPMNLLIDNFPGMVRIITRVRKSAFAQSHALFLRSYLIQFSLTGDTIFLEKANQLWDYIYEQRSKPYKGLTWGQPYNWYSKKVILAFTPRTTVTSQILHTLIDFYEFTGEERFIRLIEETANFFSDEMPRSYEYSDQVCFSYTMVDNYRVYNANMMAASALVRAGKVLRNKTVEHLGVCCLNYTMKRQNSDGSWYYYELPDNQKSKIDNYHTGYILEALAVIREILGPEFKFDIQFVKGIKFYEDNFFKDRVIPKMTPGSIYPIDIQSCAQSIITLTSLSSSSNTHLNRAKGILDFTLDNFYSGKGYFHYRKNRRGRIRKLSYIRWGDAWMYLAIVKYLKSKRDV